MSTGGTSANRPARPLGANGGAQVRAWRVAEAATYAALFLLLGLRTLSRQWLGDFWEHAAVVRELAARPLAPRHPLLDLDAPHAFASPYAFCVALLSRATGLAPIEALEAAGVCNLLLLLAGLRAFARAASPHPAAPLVTLLFTLFLWGREAWRYSGFFHLASLGHVMPYPSTFAAALTLLLLAAFAGRAQQARNSSVLWAGLIASVGALVLLVHPLTFVVLACGLAAFQARSHAASRGALRLAVALVGAVLIAAPWPYFPLLELMLREAAAFHPGNDVLYHGPLPRVWPALLGLPALARRLARDRRDPLGLFFAGLVLVYALGGATSAWSYGRVIAFAVLVLHVALASALVGRLEALRPAVRVSVVALALVLLVAPAWRAWLAPVVNEARAARLHHRPWLEFLGRHVAHDAVVLTPPDYAWYTPVFAGKLVGYPHRLAFVPDQDERRADVERYFDASTRADERRSIRARRSVRAVLLPKRWLSDWSRHVPELLAAGAVMVYESEEHALLCLSRPPGSVAAKATAPRWTTTPPPLE